MRVAMIGAGYVGLVSGACFAELGHTVTCVDKDAGKISALRGGAIPIYEPGLAELVARNVHAQRLAFTTAVAEAVEDAAAVFIAVGTPSRPADGLADLTYVYQAAREIGHALRSYAVVVTKSTVPVGTGDEIARIIADIKPDADISVVSNPEFLREGAAIDDFMAPDRVVIGTDDERARAIMHELYRPLAEKGTPIVFTARRGAELIKYASNAFLATKITFINEIADLCEQANADVQEVAHGIGLDHRIGPKFLSAGPGYGGSCFPKDLLALLKAGLDFGVPIRSIETIISINDQRKRAMARKVIAACGGSIRGRTIAVLGLTFKADTDDMRESPSVAIITALQDAGARVRAYDPQGMAQARSLLDGVDFARDAYACAEGADALVVMTEWNEFRGLDLSRIKLLLQRPILVDLRNIFRPEKMAEHGFTYLSVGRPRVDPASKA
ncbi:MAG TPA: UDP-glucose/GDP-mannose dehydrogenase family protein [Hyphomicrobiaceae bacterium]|jgi:UDPglucose 6-dehydrogenase|nr:UDP-glucose/GDP-mannose dehydrogenase family protein [Hyphomicrobiaceae bacterium]